MRKKIDVSGVEDLCEGDEIEVGKKRFRIGTVNDYFGCVDFWPDGAVLEALLFAGCEVYRATEPVIWDTKIVHYGNGDGMPEEYARPDLEPFIGREVRITITPK